jgi:hypothetical protein
MDIELFETDLGMFKATAQDHDKNLLFVQTYLIHFGEGYWENVGYMKRKEFMNLIKSHNPRKKDLDWNPQETAWTSYSSIK